MFRFEPSTSNPQKPSYQVSTLKINFINDYDDLSNPFSDLVTLEKILLSEILEVTGFSRFSRTLLTSIKPDYQMMIVWR